MPGSADDFLDALAAAIADRVIARLDERAPPPPPQVPSPAALPRYVDTKTAATMLGLGRSTLEQFRSEGKPPAWVKVGGSVRYEVSELERFMATHTRRPKK